VEIKKLLDLLVVDPAFSAEVLRAANSPIFGFASRIDSVHHALVVLGWIESRP
jgi:HD-like signal output (HDOD) protein